MDCMVGVVLVDDFDDLLFGLAIGVADVIVIALLLDVEFFELVQVSHERSAGAPRRHNRYVQ